MRTSLTRKINAGGNRKLDNLISILFFAGLILQVLEIFIYRKTIIELKIPLLIWLTPGFILTPFFYKRLNKIDTQGSGHWILHYILHTVIVGGMLLYSFMALNFYFSENRTEEKRFEIIKTGSLPGSKGHRNERKPYVIIAYEGMEKQLIFSYPGTNKISYSKAVIVKVSKGLFGFDILRSYDLE